jgi:hypothetical protein
VKVSCSVCGELFEAQRYNAKTCSVTCRKRASRSSGPAEVTALPVGESPEKPQTHPLVAQTERELDEAGVIGTVLGQTALRLAGKLAGNSDTGSAMASLSREFRTVMQQALSEGTKKTDSLDELAARRLQRASGA